MNVYYGDLHTHANVGYGKGSIETSVEVAKTNLDVWAFAGHSQWPDQPEDWTGYKHHVDGFEAFKKGFDHASDVIREHNIQGEFVAIPGYEMHTLEFGDLHVIFPFDNPPFYEAKDYSDMVRFTNEMGAMLIPHHVGYQKGRRGINWDLFDPRVSPCVEIFSKHGAMEHDRLAFPVIHNTMGPRCCSQTISRALQSGKKFGFTASSDNHNSCPGAYGEGITGFFAAELTREAVFDAMRKRRTFAMTGDRMVLSLESDDHFMGEEVRLNGRPRLTLHCQADHEIDQLQLIRNGEIVARFFPTNADILSYQNMGMRIFWGWGDGRFKPCDWDFTLTIDGGEIHYAHPCFTGTRIDGVPYHSFSQDEKRLSVRSHTGRGDGYSNVVEMSLGVSGNSDSKITIDCRLPVKVQRSISLQKLLTDSFDMPLGRFGLPFFQIERAISQDQMQVEAAWEDDSAEPVFYYARAKLINGQMGWTSPIWFVK